MGTPTIAFDEKGEKAWDCELDIYGKIRNIVGDSSLIPFRYQGQYEDFETGLYYNRFRYYDAESGTYICQDPIGLAGGMPNFYSYVQDNHIWVDPLGLECLKNKIKKLQNGEDVFVKSYKEADDVLFGAFPKAQKVGGAGKKSTKKMIAQKKAFKGKNTQGKYHKDYKHNSDGVLHGHESLPDGHPHKTTPHINVKTPEGNKATIYIIK